MDMDRRGLTGRAVGRNAAPQASGDDDSRHQIVTERFHQVLDAFFFNLIPGTGYLPTHDLSIDALSKRCIIIVSCELTKKA